MQLRNFNCKKCRIMILLIDLPPNVFKSQTVPSPHPCLPFRALRTHIRPTPDLIPTLRILHNRTQIPPSALLGHRCPQLRSQLYELIPRPSIEGHDLLARHTQDLLDQRLLACRLRLRLRLVLLLRWRRVIGRLRNRRSGCVAWVGLLL